MAAAGIVLDAFVAGVGTAGTVMVVAAHVKGLNSATRGHPLERAESPTMSTGHKVGRHRDPDGAGMSRPGGGHLLPDVEIVGFRALGRVCSACFDADTAAGTGRLLTR